MANRYVSPTGSGTRDGSSLANAANVWSINKMIVEAGPSGTVFLQADAGNYHLSVLKIYKGGIEGAPVTIKGVDSFGNAMNAEFTGTRAAIYSPTAAKGADAIRLLDGADHLKFENMSFTNVQNAFRVGEAVSDITLSNMEANNVQRFFENYQSTGKDATISGLVIEDVDIHGFSKGAIRLQYDTNDVVIRDVHADSERQDGDNFAIGIHMSGTVHDVLVKDTSMQNATDTLNRYWNGDGFATESNVYNVRFEDTYAAGNTDSGYDIKSKNTVLSGAVAEDNNRNFRIWGDGVTMDDITSINPNHRGGIGGQASIHLASNSTVTIKNSKIIDNGTTSAFALSENNADVILVNTAVMLGAKTPLSYLAWGSSLTNADGSKVVAMAYDAALADALSKSHAGGEVQVPAPAPAQTQAPAPVPTTYAISPETTSVTEGDSGTVKVDFTVTRSGDASKAGGVTYTVDGAGDKAANAADFKGGVMPGGSVTFAAGETTKVITVEVQGDKTVEANETFKVVIASPVGGTVTTAAADVVIHNEDVKPKVFTVLDKAHAIDLSSAANQTVTGAASHNSYYVDTAAKSGKDVITHFGHDDVILTTQKIFDGNNDGLIAFSNRSTLSVDGAGSKDTIVLTGDTDGLRFMGTTKAGLFVYADSEFRPAGALESRLSDDTLSGTGNLKKASTFFFDTALDINLGVDTIRKFGATDLLVTTSEIGAVNGKIAVDQTGHFALPGGTGGADDEYVAGEGGTVSIFDTAGKAVTALEFDGSTTQDGVHYYVYSQIGSTVGLHDLNV